MKKTFAALILSFLLAVVATALQTGTLDPQRIVLYFLFTSIPLTIVIKATSQNRLKL